MVWKQSLILIIWQKCDSSPLPNVLLTSLNWDSRLSIAVWSLVSVSKSPFWDWVWCGHRWAWLRGVSDTTQLTPRYQWHDTAEFVFHPRISPRNTDQMRKSCSIWIRGPRGVTIMKKIKHLVTLSPCPAGTMIRCTTSTSSTAIETVSRPSSTTIRVGAG